MYSGLYDSNRVEKVVVLSTDEAVYPINTIGISRAMAEKVMIGLARAQLKSDTIFTPLAMGMLWALAAL